MSGTKANQRRIADLQRCVDDLEREAATLRAENNALRFGRPEVTSAFTLRIAHELNNMLQTIMGKAELVLDDASVPDQTRDLWQTILDAADGGAELTQQLIAFGKTGQVADFAVAPATSRVVVQREEQRSKVPVQSGRILVAEDQKAVQDLARTVLTNAGHQVTVVANGVEAVAAMQASEFDLVLMDMQMPVMDGLSAARKIRQLVGSRSRVPIIAASGAALTDSAELAEAGINDYIRKPFILATLVRKIHSWLDVGGSQDGAMAATGDEAEDAPFVELDSLMGRAWVERGLTSLVEQVDELFAAHEGTSIPDRARLASSAHALVSLAGILGFSVLSQCCSSLEEAARSERDVVAPLARVKAAAAQALAKAAKVLGHLAPLGKSHPMDGQA